MMMSDDRRPVFIDTNILIRHVVQSAPSHDEIRSAMEHLWTLEIEIFTSQQVLRELASVLTRPQTYLDPVSSAECAIVLEKIAESFTVLRDDAQSHFQLLELMRRVPMGGKQIHDANIAAVMIAGGISRLFTLNTADFVRFRPMINLISLEDF
jgi:predicted nucleic acid-binding protein